MFLSKILKFRHTLAFRLTLWYALIFTFSTCVAFFFFYLLITSIIRERTDRELLSQANRIEKILTVKGIDAVKHAAILESQALGEKKFFFRLLYPSGIMFSSSNMSFWRNIEIKKTAVNRLINKERYVFDTVIIKLREDKIRILYAVISPGVIIQLGRSMESHTRIFEAFKKLFVTTMSFIIFSAALIGWFMAKKALSGVGEVTKTARQIAEGSLKKRVPVKNRGDEIDQLASTFNSMLDRIEKLVTGTREMNDNIAHDLKSPVTRIRGIAEVNLTTDASKIEYEKMAAGTIEECDRLLYMINTMLIISRTEAGIERIKTREVDLAALLQNACELFRSTAEDKGVKIRCETPDSFICFGEMPMLQRMTANLIDNAIKYTDSGGKVDVILNKGLDESAHIFIMDTGAGISEKDLPNIFKRFYRCDPSRSSAGTGLGLSLALTIARAHGGDITVKSSLEKGSVFEISLPQSQKQ